MQSVEYKSLFFFFDIVKIAVRKGERWIKNGITRKKYKFGLRNIIAVKTNVPIE